VSPSSLKLDHRSRLPLYVQVEQLLRDLIRRDDYRDGKLLPDEVTLARQLGISRNTLRAGIIRLTYEGLLERKAGVGTRVAPPRSLQSGIGEWQSFTHEMERKGIAVQTFEMNVKTVAANSTVAETLNIDQGREVLRLDRLRGWDDEPVVHFCSYLHPRLALTGEEDFRRPLYEIIEQESGVVADHAREEMRAVPADVSMARLFRARKGTPLLQRSRVVYDASGRPIEYAIVHYLSNRFTLTLDIQRGRQP
jgi:GntR family transcriptional regulator